MTPRAAILIFAVFLIAILAIAPARAYFDQRAQLHQLEQEAAKLELVNAQLQQHVDELNDPNVLERLARECLGMVRPGETSFVVVPKGEAPTPPDCG